MHIRLSEKFACTNARARAARASRAAAPSDRASASASAKTAGLLGGTCHPVRRPGGTCGGARLVSCSPPRSETMTGVPIACASTATRPKDSGSIEGTATTEAAR